MRYDERTYDNPRWVDRRIDGKWGDDGSCSLTRDVELGQRASQMLDMLEDENEIEYYAFIAQATALDRLFDA